MAKPTPTMRLRLECAGTVQGVGFRPAVFRVATSLGLAGWVFNSPAGVTIEVEGDPDAVSGFVPALRAALPPAARLRSVETREITPCHERAFRVRASADGGAASGSLPPDTALCEDCRRDIRRRGDRRHRYPFTTCSNCGPRFSVVGRLPYDRARTSMACFPMCPDCEREYRDPTDRRFHAEPIACPACGPRLWLAQPPRPPGSAPTAIAEGKDAPAAAIAEASDALAAGSIVAIKGLGGYQLACRCDLSGPVAELRRRKGRPTKPFAVMVRDEDVAGAWVTVSEADRALLRSGAAPILLAPLRARARIAPEVAPGLTDLGVMLPTTPLHLELFRGAPFEGLVMTSGNLSDEPIACGNREALARLGPIADLFLVHDRDVVRRLDDSVARTGFAQTMALPEAPEGAVSEGAVSEGAASEGGGAESTRPFLIRRSRGYVPRPLPLPERLAQPAMALGAHLQATTCLGLGREAMASQHVGDLDTQEARAFLKESAAGLEQLFQARARLFVVDEHPDYVSHWLGRAWAAERDGRLLRIQHHLAHAAAVLGEHEAVPRAGEQAAALILDGTGYGLDGTSWGGEWLLLDGNVRWERFARLRPIPLLGGEAAVREPWRVLAAALDQEDASGLLFERLEHAPGLAPGGAAGLEQLLGLSRTGRWPWASGAGRMFEAAGALLAGVAVNGYEGEAAARCEALAHAAPPVGAWDEAPLTPEDVAARQLPFARLLAAAARRLAGGEPAGRVARGLHETFCERSARLTAALLPATVQVIALGGGCLVNRLLREGLERHLRARGLGVLHSRQAPPGDGGLAYGQIVVASLLEARGGDAVFSDRVDDEER